MTTRFSKFGLTILPQYKNSKKKFNWKDMTKEEISETLEKLNFIRPLELINLMRSMKIKTRNKILKNGEVKEYYSKIINFGGQLELTTDHGIPHYQMWVEVQPQAAKGNLLTYFSEQVYGVKKSKQISILILTEEISSYKDYCQKEGRANLPGAYSHFDMSKNSYEFLTYLKEQPKARFALKNPYTYQRYVKALLSEPREGRYIYWFTDLMGHAGKSFFTNILVRDPRNKSIFVSVDYDRSFKMNLAEEISKYISTNGEEPEAIVLDIPRAEETKNLHEIYASLETIMDGRVRARFGGKSISFWIKEDIRIFVFSNCAPDLNSMSHDRWRIFALFESPVEKDILIQRAETRISIIKVKRNIVTWQTLIKTLPLEETLPKLDLVNAKKSDCILAVSYLINYLAMRKVERKNNNPTLSITPGIIAKWGLNRTTTTNKAPESVLAVIHE